ncbi:MAG TPA: DUF262 domain-containing HNH endonuclease family protein [Flavisolibacter sp.]|nr:DUF262 domain-containing HNH endonuclease family protein [Flavisolibacter sp.]
MRGVEETKIVPLGIGSLLKNWALVVPPNQRSYSWEKQHVDQFMIDIVTSFRERENEYFLGSIVTVKRENRKLEIVDGQQRLITASLLLAAIKDYLLLNKDNDRAEDIEKSYLSSKDLVTREQTYHMTANTLDNPYFEDLINKTSTKVAPHSASSNRKMRVAVDVINAHIGAYVKHSKTPNEDLAKLAQYLESNVITVCVTVVDEANAFTIFETLNDRGLVLSISDLLKNYLFGQSGNIYLEQAKAGWSELIGILGDETILPSYIQCYWASRYADVPEKKLFKLIKDRVRSKKAAIDLINNLRDNAKYYAALSNPDSDLWRPLGEDTKEAMRIINIFNLKQPKPLLLAILANFTDREKKNSLKKSISWTVRILVAGDTRTGQFAKNISAIAIDINNGNITKTKDLSKRMQVVVPRNSKFLPAFETYTPTPKYARYFLREIEKEMTKKGGSRPGFEPDKNPDKVNLEHIMAPGSEAAKWTGFDLESVAAYQSRLGNMTLLYSEDNSAAADEIFSIKRPYYMKSAFLHTQDLASYQDWTKESIDKRQKMMANFARTIWPAD